MKRKSSIGNRISVHHKIVSAVKTVAFVSDRVSYIVLRRRWCNIIVLNVQAPSEEKSEDSKDRFYEELEQVFYHFPTYHMKILIGGFKAKVGREIVFKPTIGNESLHQDSNDKGVRIVNSATLKKTLLLIARCSRNEKFISAPGPLLWKDSEPDLTYIGR